MLQPPKLKLEVDEASRQQPAADREAYRLTALKVVPSGAPSRREHALLGTRSAISDADAILPSMRHRCTVGNSYCASADVPIVSTRADQLPNALTGLAHFRARQDRSIREHFRFTERGVFLFLWKQRASPSSQTMGA
jgi:hypothetical protein